MSDEMLAALAARAGVATSWRDQAGEERRAPPESLRAILASLGVPAQNQSDIRHALSAMDAGVHRAESAARFVTARVGQSVALPAPSAGPASIEVTLEGGARRIMRATEGSDGALTLAPFATPGYHCVHLAAGDVTVAVAPARCASFADLSGGAPEGRSGGWGLAAQIYSLRSAHDCGVGDFTGVAALARGAASQGADFLAISPIHALFGASPDRYSPYSPSTRLFYNPIYADPATILSDDLMRRAISVAGVGAEMERLSGASLIDWPAACAAKSALFRAAWTLLPQADPENFAAFRRFRDEASGLLRDFALFEVLHAGFAHRPEPQWSWRSWPEGFSRPEDAQARAFAAAHGADIDYQIFLQWLAGRCFGEAQRACREAGMRVGLIADLAIGMDPAGSHAWSRQDEVLQGLSIGAPPDFYCAEGQNWGLTTFSPRSLATNGFAPFIETLRANLRHAGGLRIDHVMGMNRLWLIPEGAGALEGAYVDFPGEALFRLIALESWRQDALVIGEDLGTLPMGFQDFLRDRGVSGMRVLRFERDAHGFHRPQDWSAHAAAMTSTHDMIATAGWWKGADLDDSPERQKFEDIRAWDRGLLWAAFQQAGVAWGERPAPENAIPVVEAALDFVAKTPCALKLIALEDALASDVQPNVPGTTVEKPNWRHRFLAPAAQLLDEDGVKSRLARLSSSRPARDD